MPVSNVYKNVFLGDINYSCQFIQKQYKRRSVYICYVCERESEGEKKGNGNPMTFLPMEHER